ncbi:PAS and ANTAR domain-containing protein [Gordonia sp. zg691]|uniref:histidine kinase n=1 Tax=Gordonia jinghuaiqii TaxID=2758710 RepID=A0A7D7LXG5_9ACTN|nr:PAS and ANTAR domain-containing protein [Gordonia jinghuaiqii]MBD0863614.1 PAS and ANTAR domain-containing protein [Gordonia jinghuaiqii]MCR5979350.1 PAS domain-containing protein [Gordonia jinghuaiqii]QMT01134.1 PAS domain-containing protein [Gordonia jinghuaiqii]
MPNTDHRTAGDSRIRHVGSFRFLFDTEQWEWSDEVAEMHGYRPGEVTPTTELLASHKHPDDRHAFDEMVATMLSRRTPFSSRHRIIDTSGQVHHVAVVSQQILDDAGTPVGAEGFYLDLNGFDEEAVKDRVDEHVARFREHQGVIEQAKGMISLAYGVSADRAFEVMRWRSQTANVKVNELARSIVSGVHTHIVLPDPVRQSFDHLLLNAHQSDN